MSSLLSILGGAPIASASAPVRVKRLSKTSPFVHAAMSPLPGIVRASANAAPGVLSGGTLLAGTSPGDISGMVIYTAVGSSTGIDIAAQDILTNAARGVWAFMPQSWGVAAPNLTLGSNTLKTLGITRGQLGANVCFETDAPTVGVATGPFSNCLMWVDAMDGQGFKATTPLRPYPTTTSGTVFYYDFGTRAARRIYIEVGAYFAGLVLRSQDTLRPYNPQRGALKVGYFGDSIGYVLARTAKQIGGLPAIAWTKGGTGYAKQTGAKSDGTGATSNADIDYSHPFTNPSICGNFGFNDGTLAEGRQIDTSMGPLADAGLDIIIGAAGINDGVPTDIVAPFYRWNFTSGVALTWRYLRARSSALLVCVSPWTGANRGADGLSITTAYPIIKEQFFAIAGPTLYIDNVDSSWQLRRQDGSIVSGSTGSGPWLTGIGTCQAPTGVGNADLYVGDGTHPAAWSSTTLTASATLPAGTLTVAATAGATGNFPPAGTLSIQPAGSTVSYPGQVVTYTGKTGTTFTGCSGGTGTFPAGSNVYLYQTVPGEDYYGDKVAAALCAALAAL